MWTGLHAETAPSLEEIHGRRVLCAVDLAERSEIVLGYAAWLALQAVSGSNGRVFVKPGSPAAVVAEVATEFGAHLLVMGRHGGGFSGFLRQTAYSILRDSVCPMISI